MRVGMALLAGASPCLWLGGDVLHQAHCSTAASSWCRWNLLILHFGASTECVRLVWSSSDAFRKDIFSRHEGSCTVAAGAAPGLLSSCSVMVASACFPYQQRSSSGMLWWVHGIGSCRVFQCLDFFSFLAGGFHPDSCAL
jgi:hypothetical protein